ncbi:MAG: CPBP family glutamic-type intramembrane protease [Firmicutes bacterium]|nr:CPBP family glutamic-type intramembrane protease [Bacillota bacterium]
MRRGWLTGGRLHGVSPAPTFLALVDQVATWRLLLATLFGGGGVLLVARWAHSPLVGYAYGGLAWIAAAWPLPGRILKTLTWSDVALGQSFLLTLASWAMGTAATLALGFNPQAGRLSHLTWAEAQRWLWQFPLVLPVENLVLLGGLLSIWQWVRPRHAWDRAITAALAACLFGLWHVPAWGGWTMVVIGLTVLPWTIYLIATGDMVAPLLAHIWLDTLAVLGAAAGGTSSASHYLLPAMLLGILLVGLGYSIYRDWHKAPHRPG